MNFLAPWAFGLAALAPVIVLLYLLKLRRKPVSVSTLLFWQRVLEESRRRALFQKLRNVLSLLLHLLIFTLILLALAKPVLDRAVRAGVSTVLVLDTRARMQATEENGKTRFDQARQVAEGYLRQAGPLREMAILVGGPESRVVVPFSEDEKVLHESLAKQSASDAGGDLKPALDLADNLLASRAGERRIILLSDQPTADWKPKTPGVQVDVQSTGTARENVAIARFATRSLPASPETCEVLMEIQNFGRTSKEGNVEIALDRSLLDVRPFRLAPGERTTVVFPSVPAKAGASSDSRGWLTARLDKADALPCDNVAFALLPKQTPRHVLLVTKGNWFLEKLLAADSRVRFELLEPTSFRPSMAEQFDAIVFDKFVPHGMDLANLPANALFISDSPLPRKEEVLSQPLVSDVDDRHPVLRLVSLQNVTITRASVLTQPTSQDGWRFETPLRSFENPLLITGERTANGRQQRTAVIAFDLVDSDLPLRIAFPLLMGNLVQWLAGDTTDPALAVRAGEVMELPGANAIQGPVPLTAANTTNSATASNAATSPRPGSHTFQPLENGFYAVTGNGADGWIAVNTFDERESNLAAISSRQEHQQSSIASTVSGLATGWPLWRYLAIAAIALLCGEWWLFHRRRTE
ncbi:BatA domain-containing protein [Verrucomicrobiota bacterium sgz303538]